MGRAHGVRQGLGVPTLPGSSHLPSTWSILQPFLGWLHTIHLLRGARADPPSPSPAPWPLTWPGVLCTADFMLCCLLSCFWSGFPMWMGLPVWLSRASSVLQALSE